MKLAYAGLCMLVLAACDGGTGAVDGGRDAGGADCAGLADGTACGAGLICLSSACVESSCGDGFVDESRGEDCEDGNDVAFDGCDPGACTFTCDEALDCSDADPCNGEETCGGDHTCAAGTPLDEGATCGTATVTGTCRGGECVSPGCGNGFLDGGEACDDANDADGDGCDNDCQFSCDATRGCEDDDVCNGVAVCQLATHTCMPGTPLECADSNACTTDACDPVVGCVNPLILDADGDGYAPSSLGLCGTDCDDTDDTVHPGAQELCDSVDRNCDGVAGSTTIPTWYEDCDADGYARAGAPSLTQCAEPTSGCGAWTARSPTAGETDCDDTNAAVRPRATEVAGDPGDVDEDCDGTVMCYPDTDADGVRGNTPIASTDADCDDAGEARAAEPASDCDDTNAAAYPGATEVPSDARDGDENCDGVVTCLPDSDGDGYGSGEPFADPDRDCADAGEARFPAPDNCPGLANADQADADSDLSGDACDLCPDTANLAPVACPTIYDLKAGRVTPSMPGPRFTFHGLVVTAVYAQAYWVQVPVAHPDYAGPAYSSIFVFTGSTAPLYADGTPIAVGDNVDVSGRFTVFNGQLEIFPATATRATTSHPIPAPVVTTASEIVTGGARALELEGVLVTIGPGMVTALSPSFGEYTVDGGLPVDDLVFATTPFPTVGQPFTRITGVLAYRFMRNALNPRQASDIVF